MRFGLGRWGDSDEPCMISVLAGQVIWLRKMMKNDENSGTVPGRHQFIDGKLMFIAPRGIYIYIAVYTVYHGL